MSEQHSFQGANRMESGFIRPWVLGACLNLGLRNEDLAALRSGLCGPNVLFELTELAGQQRLLAAVAERLLANMLVPPDAPGRPGPATMLRQYLAEHHDRRAQMTLLLRDSVAALNGIGVKPVLLKGANSLWDQRPAWRFLRDIDLLVPADRIADAAQALRNAGYFPDAARPVRPHHHHLAPLYNEEHNGWVELHRRGGNRYAERLLPTDELIASSTAATANGFSVRLLDPVMQVLHAVVHHHVGHGGDARGTMSVKGLYEFAWAANDLTTEQKQQLVERCSRHPRLAAMLDLWVAAAARLFGLPAAPPFAIARDAADRAEALLGANRQSWWRYPGYGEEIRMAWAPERLGRLAGGSGTMGRQILRWKVIASMLPAIRR